MSLHHHTSFSYLDGFGVPEQHVERAADLGMMALAHTEHGNVSSHVRLEKAATEHGIQPIFGVELYHAPSGIQEPTENNQLGLPRRKNHLTVLSQDQGGYRNMLEVVSKAWRHGFYYDPTATGEMLEEHAEGLIVLSGCTASLLATSLVGGKWIPEGQHSYARAKKAAKKMKSIFGDAFYLEVQMFPDLPDVCRINEGYEQLGKELGIPLVATADVHYYRYEQAELRKILHAIGRGKKSVEQVGQEWNYDIDSSHPTSDQQVIDRLRATGLSLRGAQEAARSTMEIAGRCNFKLPNIASLHYPLPQGIETPSDLIWAWLRDGWKFRGCDKWPKKKQREYTKRLKYEMELIEEKGFTDYFLVLSDAVKFAKRNGLPVGPARGSAAASLTCWLLRITEVDPLLFPTLVFERFIDRTRHDLPDIDLDFDDDRRHEMREYLVARYGGDRVGNIGTFTKYKGKNSLDDVARVYNVPPFEVEKVKELLLERSSGDLRASATIEDTVDQFEQVAEVFKKYPDLYRAQDLEGNYRGMSVHAAGLVVANEPLTNACAVYTRESKGELTEVISLDKYDAEYLNVLKLDFLGLKTMGMIRLAIEDVGMTLEELYNVPLDDPDTLQGFKDNDVVGVFQFDGRAMRSVNQAVVPDGFMEVCDINALARPGPLHSGATADYIDAKHGRKRPEHYHPIVDRITAHTQGQIVYQEQILQVVRELGEFSWEEAARIRKIISKKRGEQEFNQQRGKFIAGAASHGMEEKDADRVWQMLVTSGAYAFNAAHCVSYGMLAWWTMWLKRNHPLSFYKAALSKYADKEMELLKDVRKKGISVGAPKPHSDLKWSIRDRGLLAGLLQVKGIGEKTATAMLEYRDDNGVEDWSDYKAVRGVGPKTIELLEAMQQDDDPFGLEILGSKLDEVKEQIRSGELPLPMPTHTSVDVPYEKGKDVQVVWAGIIRDRNLKDLYELHHSRTGEHLDPTTVKDPNLQEWVVLLGEDNEDILTITIDRWRYERFKKMVWGLKPERDIVVIRGVKKGFQARRAVYVSEMWVLDVEDDE